ncbi:MAG: hypothetical protein WBC15_13610, partial [Mycobacterium sp.]
NTTSLSTRHPRPNRRQQESWCRPADHSYPHHFPAAPIVQNQLSNATKSMIHGFRLSGPERTVTAVEVALERIRADPLGQALLHSISGTAVMQWIGRSTMPPALASELVGLSDDPVAAQWIVRVVLSLLCWPVDDRGTEREMIRRFLAPCL